MNVESVLIVPQSSKTKSGKTNVLKDSFFQLYEKSIHGEEQNKSKVDNANENMPGQSIVLDEKNANGLEEVETSETVGKETAVDEINTAGMPFHIDAYRNKQVNFSTFEIGRSEQSESQSNIEDTSDVLSVAKDKTNIDANLQKINDSITELMRATTHGEASVMKVGLYPEELGSVDVALKMEDGKWTTKVLVDHEEIKELLIKNMYKSRGSTGKEGMNIETAQIEVKTNSLGTSSKNIQLMKEQTNLDTSFTENEMLKQVSFNKNEINTIKVSAKQEKILPEVNIQNINDSITQLMRTTTKGETSVMKVELYPKELGSVEVVVKMEDGKWITKILVEHEEIKELFTNKVNESRGSTVKQNVTLETMQIETKTNTNTTDTNFLGTDAGDTEFMLKENLLEEVSSKKNVTDSTKVIKDQDEGFTIIAKQEVNFNVKELAAKQVSHVSATKEIVLPEENLQKVNDSIVKLMETTTQGNVRVMKVKLYPEELGSVDVTLKMEDGKIVAKILVDNEQIKQLFSNKINELSNNLFKQNINIDKIQIDVNSSANYSGGSNHNKGNYSKRNNRSPFNSKSADNMTTQDRIERSGAISILA